MLGRRGVTAARVVEASFPFPFEMNGAGGELKDEPRALAVEMFSYLGESGSSNVLGTERMKATLKNTAAPHRIKLMRTWP